MYVIGPLECVSWVVWMKPVLPELKVSLMIFWCALNSGGEHSWLLGPMCLLLLKWCREFYSLCWLSSTSFLAISLNKSLIVAVQDKQHGL